MERRQKYLNLELIKNSKNWKLKHYKKVTSKLELKINKMPTLTIESKLSCPWEKSTVRNRKIRLPRIDYLKSFFAFLPKNYEIRSSIFEKKSNYKIIVRRNKKCSNYSVDISQSLDISTVNDTP